MFNEKLKTTDLKADEHTRLMEFSDVSLANDLMFIRDITNDEADLDEFYLILSGKYAKKMRQLFSSIENELLELN